MGGVQRPRRPDTLRGEAAMDAVQAERFVTSCVEALQTWERTQGLMADAVVLCEAALAAQSRSKELHLRPPTAPRRLRPRRARSAILARTVLPLSPRVLLRLGPDPGAPRTTGSAARC